MHDIIAIIGAPGVGKSYLARKLTERLNAKLFLEGEEKDFPIEIRENLKTLNNKRQLLIRFRNKLINEINQAQKDCKERIVIMDSFRASNGCYIDMFFDGFEREVAKEDFMLDQQRLPYPDKVIFLTANKTFIRKSISLRKRTFEKNQNESMVTYFSLIQEKYKQLVLNDRNIQAIEIERSNIDFDDPHEIDKILTIL